MLKILSPLWHALCNRKVRQLALLKKEQAMSINKKSLISNRSASKKAIVTKPEVTKVVGSPVKAQGAPLKVHGTPLKVHGTPLKVHGTPLTSL